MTPKHLALLAAGLLLITPLVSMARPGDTDTPDTAWAIPAQACTSQRDFHDQLKRHMAAALSLTPDQQAQITTLLDTAHATHQASLSAQHERLKQELTELRTRVRLLLTPQQAALFDTLPTPPPPPPALLHGNAFRAHAHAERLRHYVVTLLDLSPQQQREIETLVRPVLKQQLQQLRAEHDQARQQRQQVLTQIKAMLTPQQRQRLEALRPPMPLL